jgi:GntR family transcriptional repressor for pyruvate dehydrogenase complex
MMTSLNPIERQSLSEALYRQLKHQILSGVFKPGDHLPSERALSEGTGVNRGAVREAVKRLQQAGLVSVRQGGNHEVLDFRLEAGLELLPSLLLDEHGQFHASVVRDVMAMRSALAPEIAAAAAVHGGLALHQSLLMVLTSMQACQGDVAALQKHALSFWQALVGACQNVAYQLAFNAMRKSYLKGWDQLTLVMADEFRDLDNLQELADAVRSGNADKARQAARRHVSLGHQAIDTLFPA